ncbi:YkvA family protein [Ancylobacter oerskovii]|uniref:YkvA family protein n=1 Tax=Ancylobacter oerskovii TaxID=459519 RepID=A0ABW4YRK7_9HYPH|nr:YkvA family protein [Ancylobacter oerskovii]MBS7545433.1 DUF1232 domain-containing protein [Ancylobacter oerskovii]
MATRSAAAFTDAFDATEADLGGTGNAADEQEVRAGFWRKLAAAAGRIPFAADAAAAYYCALDRNTPVKVRAVLFGSLAYFLLPTDTVPDILPMLGFTDDAAVLATALNLLAAHITPVHREAARRAMERITRA